MADQEEQAEIIGRVTIYTVYLSNGIYQTLVDSFREEFKHNNQNLSPKIFIKPYSVMLRWNFSDRSRLHDFLKIIEDEKFICVREPNPNAMFYNYHYRERLDNTNELIYRMFE